jgi:electron transfer flavoprotein alpha/beta subunit
MSGIMNAYDKKKITHFDAKALKADENRIGLKGSMTEVWKIFIPERKGEQIILEGTAEEIAQKLLSSLKDDKVL